MSRKGQIELLALEQKGRSSICFDFELKFEIIILVLGSTYFLVSISIFHVQVLWVSAWLRFYYLRNYAFDTFRRKGDISTLWFPLTVLFWRGST